MATLRAHLDTSTGDHPLTPYCDCMSSLKHILPFRTWAEIKVLWQSFSYLRMFTLSHEFVSPASSVAGVSNTSTHTSWRRGQTHFKQAENKQLVFRDWELSLHLLHKHTTLSFWFYHCHTMFTHANITLPYTIMSGS